MIIVPIIIKCPNCHKFYRSSNLMSYNTFGKSDTWSDGYNTSGSLSNYSFLPFAKCTNCETLFWIDDVPKLEETELDDLVNKNTKTHTETDKYKTFKPLSDKKEKLAHLDYPPPEYWFDMNNLFLKDLIILLDKNCQTLEKELYIRFKIWHTINNFIRKEKRLSIKQHNFKSLIHQLKNKSKYKKLKNIKKNNLQKIIDILKNKEQAEQAGYYDPERLITLIEAHREMGNFKKAKSFLKKASIYKSDNNIFYNKSDLLIKLKCKKIFKL